ncbi:hypothetical protein [Acinetobacter gerneri]|uniref:hypothetical protein n=1 Tax=Acinetobacter gerneri TaxID=202952 RepID=UPI003A86BA67
MIIKKILTIILSLSVIFPIYSSFAEAPSAEQIKLEKDKIKYKAYIPVKYDLFEAIEGDLNKDGQKDLVLIVKATDPKAIINHEDRGQLDRNRRGIIVLLNENGKYKQILKNLSCFSSENEDGGVYFAPELWVTVEKNRLHVHYGHGRYGYWDYNFRLENTDLRLIGYEQSNNHGPYVESEISVNLLTGKKLLRTNIVKDDEAEPKFKEQWTNIQIAPIYLSQIKDFDELDFVE